MCRMRRKDVKINVSPVKCEILTTLLAVSPPMFVHGAKVKDPPPLCLGVGGGLFISTYTSLEISITVESKYETTQSMN